MVCLGGKKMLIYSPTESCMNLPVLSHSNTSSGSAAVAHLIIN